MNYLIFYIYISFSVLMRNASFSIKLVSIGGQSINNWRSSNDEWNSQMHVCHLRMSFISLWVKAMTTQMVVNRLSEKMTLAYWMFKFRQITVNKSEFFSFTNICAIFIRPNLSSVFLCRRILRLFSGNMCFFSSSFSIPLNLCPFVCENDD